MNLMEMENGTSKFDVTLNLNETEQGLYDSFEYNTDLFDAATINRMTGHFKTLLEGIVAAPENRLSRLSLLTQSERQRILVDWNVTVSAYSKDQCIHQLFEAWAKKTPDAVAVVYEDRQLTYGRLNRRANQLAHHLIGLGVVPGNYVAMTLARSIELVIAQLAVLKCGAAYVPLDPDHPADRLAFMVADCEARLILSKRNAPQVPDASIQRVDVDDLTSATLPMVNPDLTLCSEMPAYVMYTSGSTGQPKGVVVPHRAIGRLVLNNGYADFNATDRVAFAANPAFDAATMEVWAPLLHGGCIVVIKQQYFLDPPSFAQILEQQSVTVLFITTAIFNQYVHLISDMFSGLRFLLNGGERCEPASFAHVLKEGPPQHLIHCYGPTETTTFAIAHEVRDVPQHATTIPLGRPIANTRIYILDSHGQPVPIGVAGELYIGGAGVACGYLNRPDLTAERFLPDPYAPSDEPDARMYKTGDLGRFLPDGTIEFLGRNDFQVKIRGFRIELGEIEATLAEVEQIGEAVVIVREDTPGDKRLVAYYTVKGPKAEALSTAMLRSHLSSVLPEYMVPAAFVALSAIPLTPNGKTDRKALPAPEGDAYGRRVFEAPIGETEQLIAQIWSELLNVEPVGRNDHFFELGGHSLMGVQAISRLRLQLGLEVPLSDLFVRPELKAFARGLQNTAQSKLPTIGRADRDADLPLSFAQQRLWFISQLEEKASAAYHIAGGVKLVGPLDPKALRMALDRIVVRHEALRTRFRSIDGAPIQVIAAADCGFALQERDLSQSMDTDIAAFAENKAARPFDLAAGPLIRGQLLRLSANEHVLHVTMHHIVSDGWSMGAMLSELSVLYKAFRQGLPDPLPPLAVQYVDYAVWQRDWLKGPLLQQQLDYWTGQLAGAPAVLELPCDHRRPAVQDYAGATIEVTFDAGLTRDLTALSRRRGATLFMTLLAGWAALLSRLSGQTDILIGTPVANRTRSEIEPLIGFFVNTLVLRLDLSGAPTAAELIEHAKRIALGAQSHQDIPFEQVVEALQPVRSRAHSPLFQVMFAWQNTPRGGFEPQKDLRLEAIGSAQATAPFDLNLSLHLAYVIYTSGSTGKPKGVMVEHNNVVRLFSATEEWFHFGSNDVWTLFHSYAFDFSVWELWGSLLYGGRLVVVPQLTTRSPDEFYQLLCRHNVTVLNQTLSAFRQLIAAQAEHELTDNHRLRLIIFGGEALETATLAPWYEHNNAERTQLVNMYGITETTVHVTYRPLALADTQHRGESPIGVRIPDLFIYILDQHHQPMPIGVAGELYIGGAGVARGYLNRPDLTAERFLPDSYAASGEPDARIYKTGDLGRWLPDGTIEFLGRNDFQVKLRGFRIEVGEIEAKLMEHPGVHEAVALAREVAPGDKRLAAYITPSPQYASPVIQMLRMENEGVVNTEKRYELPNGMMIFHQNKSETDFLYREIFENKVCLQHGIRLQDGDCIFDVGANIGLFSLFIGQYYRNTTIYSFEPIRPVFNSLKLNTKLYGLKGEIFEFGLAEKSKEAVFTFFPYNTIISSSQSSPEEARRNVRSFLFNEMISSKEHAPFNQELDELLDNRLETKNCVCQLRTVSKIIAEKGIACIDLLKIDVEGGEYEVLQGIDECDWPKIRQLAIEIHNQDGRVDAVSRMLELRGYVVHCEQDKLLQDTNIYDLYAVRPTSEHASIRIEENSKQSAALEIWSDKNTLIRDVQGFLCEQLPEYMVPSTIVVLDVLPLTPNGKLDRKALPASEGGVYSTKEYVAPVGEAEQTLAQVWAEVLDVDKVGRNDNFFHLGGHALMAMRMVSLLNRDGFDTSIADLFIYPTIKGLAAHLKGKIKNPALQLGAIPLRDSGDAAPLFLVHDLFGEVLYGPMLTRSIDSNIPVYGLVGEEFGKTYSRTLNAQATRLLRVVRTIQPTGPYWIAGWSIGGKLSYEIAAQLIGEDETVEFLCLIDTYYETDKLNKKVLDKKNLLLGFFERSDIDPVITERLRTHVMATDFETTIREIQKLGISPGGMSAAQVNDFIERAHSNFIASLKYTPYQIPLKVHLFKANELVETDKDINLEDPLIGWGSVLPEEQIQTIPVPGSHYSIIVPPNINTLGKLLSEAINK